MKGARLFVLGTAGKSWAWFRQRAHGRYAQFWLAFFSFSESSFFPVSPDVLLIAILMAGANRWVYFATLTTVASVLGGIFGYIIGAVFYDTLGKAIIDFYGLEGEIARVRELFNGNVFWTIFLAAFTPIPYKVFVLAGGFFKINFLAFLIASTLGRGARFFLVAYLVRTYGERAVRLFFRYMTVATLLLLVLIGLYIFIKYFAL